MRRAAVAIVGLCWILSSIPVSAQDPQGSATTREEFEAKLGYQTGTVTLPGGLATLRLPESFRFLAKEGSRRLLTQGWGNPPDAAEDVLGMMIPAAVSPLSPEGWGIVITFDEDGYVNDDDAAGIDYSKLLREMKEGAKSANEERRKQGFEEVTLVGWAEPPSYDQAAHKLYWAKELSFGGKPDHTLNYNIRVLGRRGVLNLNAVADMGQLSAIRREARGVLSAVEFNEGHRYSDYLPGSDKAATYGIAGLIAGAVAAKAGFFKVLWIGILAFKKVIFIGLAAVAMWVKRLFGRSKETAPAS
jgi:uncharacterized membrane-anchored protein